MEHDKHSVLAEVSNGNGSVFSKISKGSWLLILLLSSLATAVTGFFSMRESMTVGFATVDERLAEQDGRIKNLEEQMKNMVPAAVHVEREKRYELQNEFNKFRLGQLEEQLKIVRTPGRER